MPARRGVSSANIGQSWQTARIRPESVFTTNTHTPPPPPPAPSSPGNSNGSRLPHPSRPVQDRKVRIRLIPMRRQRALPSVSDKAAFHSEASQPANHRLPNARAAFEPWEFTIFGRSQYGPNHQNSPLSSQSMPAPIPPILSSSPLGRPGQPPKPPQAAIGQAPVDGAHPPRVGLHQHPHPALPLRLRSTPGNSAAPVRRTWAPKPDAAAAKSKPCETIDKLQNPPGRSSHKHTVSSEPQHHPNRQNTAPRQANTPPSPTASRRQPPPTATARRGPPQRPSAKRR